MPAHNTPEDTPARARVPEDAVPASAPPMQERVCGPSPSPAPRPSRSPASTPGSQGRRRGARAASNPNPNPAEAPPAAPAAGPNFVTALTSFVSGRLQQDGDMGRGAGGGDPNPRPDSEPAGAPLPPPNVLADTTRPNHLAAPVAASAKAARKAGATVTWASPPAAGPNCNPVPNVDLDQVGAAAPGAEDEESGWVPDSVPAGSGGGGGSGAASDVSALANGRGQVGAAGRTPHPAGCQVRATRAYYLLLFGSGHVCAAPWCCREPSGRLVPLQEVETTLVHTVHANIPVRDMLVCQQGHHAHRRGLPGWARRPSQRSSSQTL